MAAGMLAAMFAVFILQIAARYVFGWPVGWTVEVCLTLWLWLVLWGTAFCLDDRDQVRFDMVFLAVSRRLRRVFFLVSAGAVVAALALSLPDTWEYVTFMRIKRSATLQLRLNWVFSIYILFAVALILRHAIAGIGVLRRGLPETGGQGP
ncbi:MAG: TRAP transporter small permease subunit [Rhodobacteraceae bacterium]|nr:TRAP transporter small permease subunit [Paracoccaceae bacterium]